MTLSGPSFDGFDVASSGHSALAAAELVGIMMRAESLGFCRHRIATALRLSPDDLALIEQHGGRPTTPPTLP